MIGELNKIGSTNPWETLFIRPIYYQIGSKGTPVTWDTGIQIFGGSAVRDL